MGQGVTVVAAAKQFPGEAVNGDAWRVDTFQGTTRVAVIDGLGHGPYAAEAAGLAVSALENAPDLDPGQSLLRCHEALRSTRGAVISIAAIDLAARRVTFAGIGNVEGRLLQSGRETRLISYRGIVGANVGRVRSAAVSLEPEWLLAMYTDGISARFDLQQLLAMNGSQADSLASRILAGWGRPLDDATIVIARPVPA